MSKLKKILNGGKNFIIKSEVSEKIAEERAKKCVTCPNAKHSNVLEVFIKDDFKTVSGFYCDLCKCILSLKIRSEDETCPLKKW